MYSRQYSLAWERAGATGSTMYHPTAPLKAVSEQFCLFWVASQSAKPI